jgi:hypothetical protein
MGWGMLLEKEESYQTSRKNVQCSDALHSAFYPLNSPTNGWSGIDFCRDHTGGKFHEALRIPCGDNSCGGRGNGCRRSYRLALLWTSRSTRPFGRQNGNDGDCEAFIVSPGLHRGSDNVERHKRLAILVTHSNGINRGGERI